MSHICAECTDFIGGGDWGLCCKSMEYNDLCYDYTTACKRFKPGREIHPIITMYDPDSKHVWLRLNGDVDDFDELVADALSLIADGYKGVQIRDYDHDRMHPLLWDERLRS